MNCTLCGKPLSDGEPVDGIHLSITDEAGTYHGACWGKPRRDRIAELEWALRELAEQASEMIERLDVVFDAEREAIATAYRLVPDVADEAST